MLYGVNLEGASLQGSNLQGCDLRSAKLGGADLRGVNLSGAKLNHADLRDTKLGPLLISDARLLPARLDNAEARYVDFRGADLRRLRLNGSDLSYANLTGADMRDTDTGGVELTGAKMPMHYAEAVYGRFGVIVTAARAIQDKGPKASATASPPLRAFAHEGAGRTLGQASTQKSSRRFAAFDGLEVWRVSAARIDDDLAGLFFLGDDALQVDMEQAVFQAGAAHFDMLGQLEAALEGAAGNALMQIGRLLGFGFALAGDGQDAVADLDAEILLAKAGDRDGDAIMVLVAAFDVVGRIALGACRPIQASRADDRSRRCCGKTGNNPDAW